MENNNLKYRVAFFPSIEMKAPEFVQSFATLEQAKAAREMLANYTLHLHDNKVMRDYSNFSLLEIYVDGEWVDYDTDIEEVECNG